MTYIYKPHHVDIVSEAPDQEITWRSSPSRNVDDLLQQKWTTVRSLKHIANPASGNIRERTRSLICTQFQITDLPNEISGLQLDIVAQRNGRIVDELVQLTFQNQAIGKNNFVYHTDSEGHLKITNETSYGGPTDLWEVDITHELLRDPSFGIILKFQSHPYYPHSVGMILDSVSLTVY